MIFQESYIKYADRIAVISDDGNTYSYQDIKSIASGIAKFLKPNSLVVNFCRESLGALFGYLACTQVKSVPLMLDAKMDKNFLLQLILCYRPEYLWIPTDFIEFVSGEVVYSEFGYSLICTSYVNNTPLYDDLSLILTTSGSTGSSKMVRLSEKNVTQNARSIISSLEITNNDRAVLNIPICYAYGLSIVNTHLLSGAVLLITDASILDKGFWNFMHEQRATTLAGVPFTYQLLSRLGFLQNEYPFLKILTQAGGKLSDELVSKFAEYCLKYGKKFYIMYGQTEATARISYTPLERIVLKPGSVGRPVSGGCISLYDSQNTEIVEVDKEGELVYTGENVMLGYATTRADLAKGDETHGVLFTGDIAKRDQDGDFYIVGRKTRFVKVFGNRLNLDEIQLIITTRFCECACIGDDSQIYLFVENFELVEKITEFVSLTFGLHFQSFTVSIIDKIPRTSNGKYDYSVLKSFGK